jgi:hypothetical protein
VAAKQALGDGGRMRKAMTWLVARRRLLFFISASIAGLGLLLARQAPTPAATPRVIVFENPPQPVLIRPQVLVESDGIVGYVYIQGELSQEIHSKNE